MLIYPHSYSGELSEILSLPKGKKRSQQIKQYRNSALKKKEIAGVCNWFFSKIPPTKHKWCITLFDNCNLLIKSTYSMMSPRSRYDLIFVSRDKSIDQEVIVGWHDAFENIGSRVGEYTDDQVAEAKTYAKAESEKAALKPTIDEQELNDPNINFFEYFCKRVIQDSDPTYELAKKWLEKNAEPQYEPFRRSIFDSHDLRSFGSIVYLDLHTLSDDPVYCFNPKLIELGVYPIDFRFNESHVSVYKKVKSLDNYQHFNFSAAD